VASLWRRIDTTKLVDDYAVTTPRPPVMQSWGMKVGFITYHSGALWHVAMVPL
jgi:hypothetical protein